MILEGQGSPDYTLNPTTRGPTNRVQFRPQQPGSNGRLLFGHELRRRARRRTTDSRLNNPHVFTSVQDPKTPPATTALPTNQLLGINDSGIAVGFYVDASGNSHGYTFNTKTDKFSAPINAPGAASTTAAAIDNAGDIAGFFTNNGGADVFRLRGHRAEPSPRSTIPAWSLLRYSESTTTDCWSATQSAPRAACSASHLTIGTDTWQNYHVGIDSIGLFATTFNGVNDHGDIVGFYVNKARATRSACSPPRRAPSVAETGATAQSFDAYSLLAPDAGMPSSFHHGNCARGRWLERRCRLHRSYALHARQW